MRGLGLLAGAALVATTGLAGAQEVRGLRAGDFMVGFGAVGVLPTNGGSVGVIGGRPEATNSASPLLDFTYFMTPNFSANLIAATTRHDIRVRNSALGDVSLGHVWALPPTLTVQYHPMPASRFSPYVGLGLNATWFYGHGGSRAGAVNRVRVQPSVGVAPSIGFNYEISPNWVANLDLKWVLMQPDVSVNSGTIRARADINPFVLGATLRYRF
ncbi:OmpW/AlkL family protein [Roseococcus thiosulfatophilus]|uniref:OmpW/AlkL family protein n=1 Tax=Roseococcus thiosulfatophilus TaxID=35813 RepID=UPI001A8C708D|nr:OmpW family protein [Roseococcus thiosulfatophilus]